MIIIIRSKWYFGDEDLTDIHEIRKIVFVEEQSIPASLEIDDKDSISWHLLIYEDSINIGTGRILIMDNQFHLGRIAVLKDYRNKGYGDFLVRLLIRKAFEMGADTQYLDAQKDTVEFYEKLGFSVCGDQFTVAGIPHFPMKRQGDIFSFCG